MGSFEQPQPNELSWPGRWLQRILPAVMGLMLIGGLLGGVRLALSLGQPFPGFAVAWRKEAKLLGVNWTTPPWWPGMTAGIKFNDRILCIDGYQPSPDSPVYGLDPRYADVSCPNGGKKYTRLFRERFESSKPEVDFLVDRAGQFVTISDVPLLPFRVGMLLEMFLPSFLLGVGLWAVGFVVYRINPDAESNLAFAAFTTILAGFAMTQSYPARISDRMEDMRVMTMLVTIPWMPFLGAVLFHVIASITGYAYLPRPSRRLFVPYYVVSLLVSLLGVFVYVLRDHPVTISLNWLYTMYIMGSMALAAAWGLLSLGWAWRTTSSKRVRNQARLVGTGLAITLMTAAPYVLYFATTASDISYVYNAPYLGLGFVAVMAYAILRYQVFASKARLLTLLLVGIACIWIANLVHMASGPATPFLPILAAALVTGLALEARRGPTSFFNRLLRRESLDYRAVAHFGQRVGELQQVDSLLRAAGQSMQQDLDVEYLDAWLLDAPGRELTRFCEGKPVGTRMASASLIDCLRVQPSPARDGAPAAAGYHALLGEAEAGRVAIWAPLVERGQVVGLLGLGPRWTGEVYDEQDLELVGILARRMALSILNTRQLERLEAASRQVVQAEENERLKIARELHDTILQFLLVLTYRLDELRERQPDVAAEIEHWQGRISAEADQLRSLLSYLRAPEILVQRGLLPSLQAWIEGVSAESGLAIETHLEAEVEPALLPEAKVAIYRVCREAVHNALKHSNAHHVTLSLGREGGEVCFSIQDDGRGCDLERALQASDRGYSSLHDMQAHVERVGGQLAFQSAPGQGMTVSGRVPAGEEATGMSG